MQRVYLHWDVAQPEHTMILPKHDGDPSFGRALHAFVASYNQTHASSKLQADELVIGSERRKPYHPDHLVFNTVQNRTDLYLSLIHISEPTRLLSISYAVFCLKKKKQKEHLTNIITG
eukprot:TRINITY_DN45719_c0_g1_i1.p2 TRINITY_DN45719_c0_g1~~TRINITY_DN45719_c0_g1_i1.p2  ORF type:complete len:118 (-),score=30.41 TRINITY_DN45719_c0_g1_i1:88-441(-)